MRRAARSLRGISPQQRAELDRRGAEVFAVTPPDVSHPLPMQTASSDAQPTVIDTASERHLRFRELLQSRMRVDDPYLLVAPYTRQMMSFLLFNPDPVHILMIGLGGGSLPKFCYRHLPEAKITVVELDARVIALRDSFFVPPDDRRFRVVHDDGVRYLARRDQQLDVILVDAFDAEGVVPELASSSFFDDVAQQLTGDGVLIMNLLGEPASYAAHVRRVRTVFGDHVLLVTVPGNDNVLLFAFREEAVSPSAPQLMLRARQLQSQYRLHFRSYLQSLREAYRVPEEA